MSLKHRFYPESQVGGLTNVDGTLVFYSRVNSLLYPDAWVVDVGCGRGAYGEDPLLFRRQLRILKGKCQRVIGIDVDPAGEGNPFLDEFRRIEGGPWPVEDAAADLVLADNVLEHLTEPEAFFEECWRILKPGGWTAIRTPNVWSYFGLVSRLVPNPQHVSVLQKAKEQVKEEDTFPTFYRCNTLPTLKRTLARHAFDPVVYGYEAEPSYLSFSPFFYFLGVLHQRFAPGIVKVGLHAFGRKIERS